MSEHYRGQIYDSKGAKRGTKNVKRRQFYQWEQYQMDSTGTILFETVTSILKYWTNYFWNCPFIWTSFLSNMIHITIQYVFIIFLNYLVHFNIFSFTWKSLLVVESNVIIALGNFPTIFASILCNTKICCFYVKKVVIEWKEDEETLSYLYYLILFKDIKFHKSVKGRNGKRPHLKVKNKEVINLFFSGWWK